MCLRVVAKPMRNGRIMTMMISRRGGKVSKKRAPRLPSGCGCYT
jgi:hypothetical protein